MKAGGRWCVVIVGEETGKVIPLAFTRCWRRATAAAFVKRMNARRFDPEQSLTHWEVRRWAERKLKTVP